eukprot:TRINITY_DN4261_c0_g1_i2.p1 TRINITY_DN4261_c0_g1~~TRINITY_DN4261_c0_g1_i2.p1  ORF type:complete len:941 (+),score=156.82 TRINITY_DN4261_c0_g1_i2:187-3009(+)
MASPHSSRFTSELDEKLKVFSKRAESGSPARVVTPNRDAVRTPTHDTYRSGWCRPPQVSAPLSFLPQPQPKKAEGGDSSRRSTSVPTSRATQIAASGGTTISSAISALRRYPSSGALSMPRADVGQPSTSPPPASPSFADRVSTFRSRSLPQEKRLRSPTPTAMSEDSQSDAGMSASSRQLETLSLGEKSENGVKLSHKGWLSKRTSGKISARWQHRYFTLEGCVLRYHANPGGVTKRSFDLRKVQQMSIDESLPRELELDFGFRVWRLRAESPEVARRWLFLLEAGSLVGGNDCNIEGTGNDDLSDDDSSLSSCTSTADSLSSSKPSTPKFGGRKGFAGVTGPLTPSTPVAPAVLLPSPTIADQLEVDPKKLDARFQAWIPTFAVKDDAIDNEKGCSGRERVDSKALCAGMTLAFHGLWGDISGTSSAGSSSRPTPSPPLNKASKQALAKIRMMAASPGQSGTIVHDAIEGILSEYLLRLHASLERWIQLCDPMADEVADVIQWLLVEGGPALRLFENGAVEVAKQSLSQSSDLMQAIERLLFSQWEARSCDEAFWTCEGVFSSPLTNVAEEKARAQTVLEMLDASVKTCLKWRFHPEAFEQAASVLIASLNAALRSYRKVTRPLLGKQEPAISDDHAKRSTKKRITRAFRRFRTRTLHELQKASTCMDASAVGEQTQAGLTSEILANAISIATAIASFCFDQSENADLVADVGQTSTRGTSATSTLCTEVLAVFAGAFKGDASGLASILVKSHYEEKHCRLLSAVSFRSLPTHSASSSGTEGLLGPPHLAALIFVDENLPRVANDKGNQMSRNLLGTAIGKVLMRLWLRRFSQRPPKLSSWGKSFLLSTIAADRNMLNELVVLGDKGAGQCQQALSTGSETASNHPVAKPLCIIFKLVASCSTMSVEEFAAAEENLKELVGSKQGTEAVQAVRWTTQR